MFIRKLRPDDWLVYKTVRLKSLEDAPQAFESSLSEELDFDEAMWRSRLTQSLSSFCFGAFSDAGTLCAIAGFRQGHKMKTQHKSYVWGVYVLPEHRSSGLGLRLMESVIQAFNGLFDISSMQLTVTSNNLAALSLYQKLGFVQYGIETDAIRVDGKSYDEILMCLIKSDS